MAVRKVASRLSTACYGAHACTLAMPRAWSFARVSTAHQAAAGGGLQRQAAPGAALAWCQRNGYELVDQFSFAGSAWKGRHLAEGAPLQAWLQQAIAGQLGPSPALLVEEVDRFTRQAGHVALGPLLTQVFPAGVRIVNLREGVVYCQEAFDRDDRLLADLLDDIRAANRYSTRLSRRLSSYWEQVRQKVAAGEVVRPDALAPFWISAAGGCWFLNENAPLARRIFDRALEVGAVSIARELNADGVPAPARRGNPARPWSSGALIHHLRNPAAYGAVRLLRGQIQRDGYFPPLLSREEWDQVQASIQRRRQDTGTRARRDVVRWVGQGLTRCECGARVQVMASGTGRRHLYLQCERRRNQVGACGAITHRLDVAAAHLLTRLQPAQLRHLLDGGAGAAAAIREATTAQAAAATAATAAAAALQNATAALQAAILDGRSVAVFVETHELAQAAAVVAHARARDADATLAALVAQQATGNMDAAVVAFLQGFATGHDTPAQRLAVNRGLARLGIRITLAADRPAMALSAGAAPPQWEPMTWGQLEHLSRGRSGLRTLDLGDAVATIDGEFATVYFDQGPDSAELPDGDCFSAG